MTVTERMSPGEYERWYADACVKADVVPALCEEQEQEQEQEQEGHQDEKP